MTATLFTGPLITAGNLLDNINNTPQKTAPDAGPNLDYKASGFLDVRFSPISKEKIGNPGSIPAFFSNPLVQTINFVPSTASAGGVAAAQHTASGTALTFAAASAGIATGIPYYSPTSNSIVTAAIALDFGFDSANCTSGSKTITVANSAIYQKGMPVCVANVGNAAGTTALLTFVTALASATTITVNDAPQATNSATPIGGALPGWGNLINLPPSEPTFASPYIEAGVGLFFDSTQPIMRGISITGLSGGAGGVFTVVGADIYGNTQTQAITVAAGANVVKSTKTWKYINSITPNFTDSSHNYSVNTIDLFGFPLLNTYWEQLEIFDAGALITSSTGWTAADTTSPATTTTGDPRGTYALQTAANASNRLVVYQVPSLLQIKANSDNPAPLYGVTPV